ncbi:P-loop NTPase fold protein [Methylomarinovum tepidoasis]|nr:P-loop NTPase fold protein [Methylomarinovum sp. IN45]
MKRRLSNFSLLHPGPLWAIRGDWGSGKSYLMGELQRRLEAQEKVAVVSVHIWREQSEVDLHQTIVDAILSHPKVMRACFPCYPTRILLRRMGQGFLRILPRGLRLSNGYIDAKFSPDRLMPLIAQRDLEWVVACARACGLRIVLILDEVDRAIVPVAQAAIVLTRRALNLPGLAVILPYVGAQLQLKVFNPLHDYSPDLHQTLLTHLESRYPPPAQKGADGESLVLKLAFDSQQAGRAEDRDAPDKARDHLTHLILRRDLREETLVRHYATLTKDQQQILIEQAEEKYLSLRDNIPELGARDIPGVLQFETIKPLLRPEWQNVVEEKTDALGHAVLNCGSLLTLDPPRPPVIRHFEGHLAEYFARVDEFADIVSDDELLVLWITTLAWRRAQLIRGLEGERNAG